MRCAGLAVFVPSDVSTIVRRERLLGCCSGTLFANCRSMMTMMRTSLRAAQSTLEQRVLCRPLLMWQQKQAQRDLVTVPPRITKGGTIGEQIDLLLKQVDERWDFIQDPKHMGGVLQMLRYCHILKRSLPRGTHTPAS